MLVVLSKWYKVPSLLVLLAISSILLDNGVRYASAQPAAEVSSPIEQEDLLIAKVRIKGDDVFSNDQLQARIRTRANRRFLRIPGFNWWLWLYNLGNSGFFGERVGNALKSTGEPPAYLDYLVLEQDVERVKLMYQQAGYRNARVQTGVDTLANRKLEVVFSIEQGKPTHVRTVTYKADSLALDLSRGLINGSLLRKSSPASEGETSFKAGDQLFSEALLHEERKRILDYLRKEGYAAVSRDSIKAVVVPATADSFDVNFVVNPGDRYKIKNIHFNVNGPESGDRSRADTLWENDSDYIGRVTSQLKGDKKLKANLLFRSLQFAPGEWYDQEKVLESKRALEATGVFLFTRIEPLWENIEVKDNDAAPGLPFRIDLETKERHRMQFETFMLQRSGVLTTSENELGMGIGVTYENANLFGSGELFRLNTTGSLAGNIDSTFFNSAQAEITTSLTLPYITGPFTGLERIFDLYDARTQLSLSFLTARRAELQFVIRGRGTARFRLEMQHSPTVVSYVDLFDMSLSNPDTLDGFTENSLGRIVDSIQDPIQRDQVEEDYTQPQINSSLRYTLRSANVNPLRREQGYSFEGAFELGGNLLPYLLDRYAHTPGVLEGHIPGLSLFQGSGSRNDLIYRQYMRFSSDLRKYNAINQNTVFAWKFVTGIAHPIGQAELLPFDRRFYSGGASSVRGWQLRSLGPGRVSSETISQDSVRNSAGISILGADIKLEGSVELRNTMLRRVLAADWILTFFGDAGNVWLGPRNPGSSEGRFRFDSFYKEIGVSGGVGLRFAWDYLILRLDLAYRVYDPSIDGGFVSNSLRNPRLHFGIGHAF